MSDTVWISIAAGTGTNLRPFANSFADTELVKDAIEWGEQNNAGEPLSAQCFPSEIYGMPDAKESSYKLPDLFSDGVFWVISKKAADVLRQFNLGEGGLYPVKVLKSDRQTLVEGDWSVSILETRSRRCFCLNQCQCARLISEKARKDGGSSLY